jgi:hypothetical protein
MSSWNYESATIMIYVCQSQSGRIFASWAIVYFGSLFEKEVAQFLNTFFTRY